MLHNTSTLLSSRTPDHILNLESNGVKELQDSSDPLPCMDALALIPCDVALCLILSRHTVVAPLIIGPFVRHWRITSRSRSPLSLEPTVHVDTDSLAQVPTNFFTLRRSTSLCSMTALVLAAVG